MKELLYKEIRDANKVIGAIENAEERTRGDNLLLLTVKRMFELSNLCRKKGMLAFEQMMGEINEMPNGKYLKMMTDLIVDGTDPDLVEEICTAKYYSSCIEGYEALQYLVMLYGTLAIQGGENTYAIEKKLLALLPENVSEGYKNRF